MAGGSASFRRFVEARAGQYLRPAQGQLPQLRRAMVIAG